MRLTRQALSVYDSRLETIEGAAYEYAASRISAYLEMFPGASAADVREFAIEVVNGAVLAFGDAASTAAADLYAELAEQSGVAVRSPVLDTSDVSGYVRDKVRYKVNALLKGDAAGFVHACAMQAVNQVGRRANQTMRINAKRDGLKYARVPMGGETCTFCAMLASRGFTYHSAKTAGEGNHYHNHCRCKVVPGFDGMAVDGYDPGEWHDTWLKFREIDDKELPEFDRKALKRAYVSPGIDYGKVEAAMDEYGIPAAKFEKYALDPERAPDKATAFRLALGYEKSDADEVAARVYEYVSDHAPDFRTSDAYGDRFTTDMIMDGKDGKQAKVRVGWIRRPDSDKLALTTIFVDS